MGSTGEYRVVPEDTMRTLIWVTDSAGNQVPVVVDASDGRTNRDPRDAFFGAILTYSFNKGEGEESRSPMLSLGAVFNRRDPLYYYLNSDPKLYGPVANFVDVGTPVGKVDVMLGYALPSGGKLGAGAYLAFQNDEAEKQKSSLVKGTVGVNWPLGRTIDLEASMGVSLVSLQGVSMMDTNVVVGDDTVMLNIGDTVSLADNDVTIQGDVRLFSAMTAINGDFVPHFGMKYSQLSGGERMYLDIDIGLGLNVNIDKGFFWAGLEGIYKQSEVPGDDLSGFGARVSFGIERNVMWDWFVARVGCMKEILYVTEGTKGRWEENLEYDADDDLVGFGIGLNVENRLKFDILVAEDIVHTLTNLFSGEQHHVFTRIDATFSF
jgi:hypothetical protein